MTDAEGPYTLEVRLLEGVGDHALVDDLADALYERDDVENPAISLDEQAKVITVSFDIPAGTPAEASATAMRAVGETLATAARAYVRRCITEGRSWPAALTPPELQHVVELADLAAGQEAMLRAGQMFAAAATVMSSYQIGDRERVPA